MSTNTAKSKTAPIEDDDTPAPTLRDVRHLAEVLAPFLVKQLASLLSGRASVAGADVSPRPGREMETWRDEEKGSGSSDPIPSENSGESSWSEREAREIVGSIRRRRRPKKIIRAVRRGVREERTTRRCRKRSTHTRSTFCDDKQNKPGSVENTMYRLGAFFPDEGHAASGESRASADVRRATTGSFGRGRRGLGRSFSVDSHRTILAEAKIVPEVVRGEAEVDCRGIRSTRSRASGSGSTARLSSGSTRRGGGWRRRPSLADGGRREPWRRSLALLMGMRAIGDHEPGGARSRRRGEAALDPGREDRGGASERYRCRRLLQPHLLAIAEGKGRRTSSSGITGGTGSGSG